MTINDVIRKIEIDANITSRFPVRLIFTESLSDYISLVKRLEKITEKSAMLNVGDFCAGVDKFPVKSKID